DNVVQVIAGQSGGILSGPAFCNNTLFEWGLGALQSFTLTNGRFSATPTGISQENSGFPGATPSVSSNGNTSGVVWAIRTDQYNQGTSAVLYAFDASNVATELYNSSQNSSRDAAGAATKFAVPTIANGKVYVGTAAEVGVYGLLNGTPTAASPVISPASQTFTGSLSVTMTDSTSGATIYYTTNGSTPTTASALYSSPISVSATTTIKAIAAATGMSNSNVSTATYTYVANPGGTGSNFVNGFSSAASIMTFNGSTTLADSRLQLTDGGLIEASSAWFNTPVNIQTFTNDFTFQIANPGADGFTFTIQNIGLTALGPAG